MKRPIMKAAALFVMMALLVSSFVIPTAAADEPTTLAHWKFQNEDGYYTGSVDDDNLTFIDLTGNGNDLVTAVVGNGDQLDIFDWDEGCDITSIAKSESSLKFDNTKAKAATVDPYDAASTKWTGGYTSGKYLETVAGAPLNSMTFEEGGWTMEIVFKLSSELDNEYNRYTGLFSRQGVVESQNEPPFSLALAEWDNDENGVLGGGYTWMQYLHVDDIEMKTNKELGDNASQYIYAGVWHHLMAVHDGDYHVYIYLDGELIWENDEFPAINVTDPSFSWEVGVGRKNGAGHESDSKNEDSPKGMIRRLFAGDISEIRVTAGPIAIENSLWIATSSAAETPAAPGFETADAAVASIGKTAITGVTPNGGTDHFGDEAPDNLWDGDVNTKFCTNSLPAIAYAKLDGTYSIDGVAIATANDNSQYGRIPTSWTLSGSNDGENWEVFYTGDDSLFEQVDFTYFATAFDASASYSQVKFEIATSTDEVVQVSEVVLTGTKTGDAPAEATAYTYPGSGESGNLLKGTVIGNETGWGGNADRGASAVFDGNPETFFDPPEKGGDNYTGMQFDSAKILEKVCVLSRYADADWNERFDGATIDGSNDGVNWQTLWQSETVGTAPEYYVITDFNEFNTGYTMFRYHNEKNHGDIAELEFYGVDAAAPATETVEETVTVPETTTTTTTTTTTAPQTFDVGIIAAIAAVISLAGFAVAKKH